MGSFKPNRKALAKLRRTPEHKAMLRAHAERVKDHAERESPIGESEDYIHSFVITETPTAVRVGNRDFAAHLIEWGSVNNPPWAPLRRGVRAAGLRLDEDGKPSDE